jgi:hypothetical protein
MRPVVALGVRVVTRGVGCPVQRTRYITRSCTDNTRRIIVSG